MVEVQNAVWWKEENLVWPAQLEPCFLGAGASLLKCQRGAQAVACYNHSDHLVIYKYLQATVDVSSTTQNLSR